MKCLRNCTDQLQIGRRLRGRSPILGTSQKNCTPSFLMRTIQSLLGRIGFWDRLLGKEYVRKRWEKNAQGTKLPESRGKTGRPLAPGPFLF